MKRQKIRWRLSRRARKILLISAASIAGLLIFVNAALWVVYRDRTYPRTMVMSQKIGSVPYSKLSEKVSDKQLLPEKLVFTYSDKEIALPLAELGISKNVERTTKSADKQRSWLPMLNFFKTPQLQAPIAIDADTLQKKSPEIAAALRKDAVDAKIVIQGEAVTIEKASNGHEIATDSLRDAILRSLDKGKEKVTPAASKVSPKVQADSLKEQQKDLQAQLKTPIVYKFGAKSKQATATEVASWYISSGQSFAPAIDKISAYITATGASFGIRVKDIGGVAATTQSSLSKKQPLTATLIEQKAVKTIPYCVATKGVDASHLPTLKSKLQQTYGSSKGWSINGLVEYSEVPSGCSFTVWLTAAALMPSFGAICDSMWSCRVGPNVVINFDRWQNASPAWNANGGTLDEYRHMVINHETGHWLGFGHASCPGPGQQAPVMQQQSINLQGCSFNAWPTAGEVQTLRQKFGI